MLQKPNSVKDIRSRGHICCSKVSNYRFLALCAKYWPLPFFQDIIRSVTMYTMLAYVSSNLWLLVPHAIGCLIIGAMALIVGCREGVKTLKHLWNTGNHTSCKFICKISINFIWCMIFAPLIFFIFVILMIMAFPSCTFLWTCFSASSHFAGRFFNDGTNDYMSTILKYVMNNEDSMEIKKRIIACNYYIMSVLSQQIEENMVAQPGLKCTKPELLINFIANTHNNNVTDGVGVSEIKWSDLKNKGSIKNDGGDFAFCLLFVALFVYNMGIIIGLMVGTYNDFPLGLIIMGVVYIVVESVCFMFQRKMIELLFYCYHLLPYIANFKGLKMDEKFVDILSMMDGVEMIYEIMYDCSKEIQIVMDASSNINPDIAQIIVEYLWVPLPLYQDGGNDFEMLQICE